MKRRRLFRISGENDVPGRLRDEVDDEIRFHLERKVEALVARGWDRAAAEREARRRFGDVERVREEAEAMARKAAARKRWGSVWRGLREDVTYAGRQLRASPVFTAVALLTLALGIGVNTAIFSVVDGVLFRPLSFPESDELVVLWSDVTRRGGPDDEWLSWANFRDLRDQARSLEAAAAWGGWGPPWTDPAEPRQLLGARVSRGMFSEVLGVRPFMGRSFRPEDHEAGAPARVLVSHGFWTEALGADPDVVGRTLTLMDRPHEVVGVMGPDVRPPFLPGAQLWAAQASDPDADLRRGNFSWRAVGRLADGTTLTEAGTELERLGSRLEERFPESNTGMGFRAVPLRTDMVGGVRAGLLVLLGAVGLVLLVACVNVANLLLARARRRRVELAVRSALGAGMGRLVRQLLTESLVLAVLGGVLGAAMAWLTLDVLVAFAPPGTPRIEEAAVDGRVLAFTGAATLLAGFAFGLVPALRVSRSDLHHDLRDGGRGPVGTGGGRLRSGLVVGQVSLAVVLLVGAGLLVRSFQNLRTADLGFEPAGILTMQVNLPPARYPDVESVQALVRGLEERLEAIPGVTSAALTGTLPLLGFDGDVSVNVEGRPLPGPGESNGVWYRRVSPSYLPTMEIDVVQGRGLQASDGPDDPRVVVINETMAARLFPGENPVGRRINYNDPADPVWREVVGVARDIRNFGVREESRMALYAPTGQSAGRVYFPVLKVDGRPESVVSAVRAEVAELDPSLALARVQPMEEIVRGAIASDRFVASLLGLFATVATALAVVGLYGVVSYNVGSRMREMGVRMALGAGAGSISGMVLRRSLGLVALGVVMGVGAALAGGALLRELLFGVAPLDPVTFVGVPLILGAAAAVAAAIPALRAARVDPSVALRSE